MFFFAPFVLIFEKVKDAYDSGANQNASGSGESLSMINSPAWIAFVVSRTFSFSASY
jgi:hypothetical protein